MNRRTFTVTAAALLAAPLVAEAQPTTGKIPRIAFLTTTSPTGSANFDAFQQGLRELGYVEGKDIVVEHRWVEGKKGQLAALATELVRLNVDVIVTGHSTVRAAQNATKTIPIVFVTGDDPVAAGFVASLARPGGNITGLSSLNVELEAKRLALLKEAIPGLKRVAVLLNPDSLMAAPMVATMESAALSIGVRLQIVKLRAHAELTAAIAAATRGGAEALAVVGDPLFFSAVAQIAELTTKARLPAIAPFRQFPEANGFMSYGSSVPEAYRRLAAYVDKILKGAKPADLPVEQPTKFELVINRASRES